MSKLIELRFEYVCFDNTTLANIPPTYPSPADVYQAGYVATVADAYGILPVNSTGPSVTLGIPAGASLIIVGDPANTAPIVIAQAAVPKMPLATPTALNWPIMPNQIVSLPGVLNMGAMVMQGTTTAGVATTAVPFAAQVMWSW